MLIKPITETVAYSYIRFSTVSQSDGDSLRRQIEKAVTYAAKRGMRLDDTLTLRDLGVSAYSGAQHTGDTALGRFLNAIQTGQVPGGSFLLIEAMDRLDRREFMDAMQTFSAIINRGITIVTLEDEQEYSRKTLRENAGLVWLLVGKMSQAAGESQRKSDLVGAAWRNKKKNAANGVPLSKTCPAWLRLSADRKSYEVIPDRAAIVERIFRETVLGDGKEKIISRLNDEGVPTFSKTEQGLDCQTGKRTTEDTKWHASYVYKILTNRAVLGEYQPCLRNTETKKAHRLDKKQPVAVPSGDPIKNYFPAIIDYQLWQQATEARQSRQGTGGPKGTSISNLLSGKTICAECGGRVVFKDKGERWKDVKKPRSSNRRQQYLICDSAIRNTGCTASGMINYPKIESKILNICLRLAEEKIISSIPNEAAYGIEAEIARLNDTISGDRERLESLVATFSGGMSAPLAQAMQKLSDSILANETTLKAETERLAKARPTVTLEAHTEALRGLLEGIEAGDYTSRLRAQTALRAILDNVVCDFSTKTLRVQAYRGKIEFSLDNDGKLVTDVISHTPGGSYGWGQEGFPMFLTYEKPPVADVADLWKKFIRKQRP